MEPPPATLAAYWVFGDALHLILSFSFLLLLSNNQTRGYILKVFLATQSHFQKILNLDEIVKRLVSVTYTNDPVARALTLRVLGSMSAVLAARVDVHQRLKVSLEAHEPFELEAAIYATDRICASSPVFAEGVSDKISVMVEGLELPTALKLRLIRVFRHMHHNPRTARKARELCEKLLEVYNTSDFVICLLDTLTHLSAKFLVSVDDQVTLLFRVLGSDPRQGVKLCSLRNLASLASLGISFHADHLGTLAAIVKEPHYDDLLLRALLILKHLTRNQAQWVRVSVEVLDLHGSEVLLFSSSHRISSLACEVMVGALKAYPGLSYRVELLARFTTSLCIWINKECLPETRSSPVTELVTHLRTLLAFVKMDPSLCFIACGALIPLVLCASGDTREPLLKALFLLAVDTPAAFRSSAELKQILFLQGGGADKHDPPTQAGLLKICLQAYSLPMTDPARAEFVAAANTLIRHLIVLDGDRHLSANHWILFEIAQEASCAGFHEIAEKIFPLLQGSLATEAFHFWLKALSSLSSGEAALAARPQGASPFEGITTALVRLHESLVAVEALSAANAPRMFHKFYLSVRVGYLELFLTTVATLRQLAGTSKVRDHLTREISRCRARWSDLAEQVDYVASMFIDIDHKSSQLLLSYEAPVLFFFFFFFFFSDRILFLVS